VTFLASQPSDSMATGDDVLEPFRAPSWTRGKRGRAGQDLQNVISVAMLSEGWDAKNVTHILGLRAFTSQLLCEQVIGRGLRRVGYDTEQVLGPDGVERELFRPEFVNVFGVPLSIFPGRGRRRRRATTPAPEHADRISGLAQFDGDPLAERGADRNRGAANPSDRLDPGRNCWNWIQRAFPLPPSWRQPWAGDGSVQGGEDRSGEDPRVFPAAAIDLHDGAEGVSSPWADDSRVDAISWCSR